MAPDDDAPRRLRRAEAILARRIGNLAVAVEDLHDSHNIDAVVRTAEALGLQHLYRIETDTSVGVHPKVTQGAQKWLTLHRFTSAADGLAALRGDGYTIWAADVASGARPLDEMVLPERLAVVLGSEGAGLSAELREGADDRFYLPMVGFTGSLNVSVSAAIVLWELVRRFAERTGQRGDLPDEEKAALRDRWYRRLARTEAQKAEFPTWLERPPEPLFEAAPPPERKTLQASRKDHS